MNKIEIQGQYNNALVFADIVEPTTYSQILELMNQSWITESQVRIMPDCHAGAGCVIGTTMTIKDKIVPNLVGVDIGCGMLTAKLNVKELDFKKLDDIIRKNVPAGHDIRKSEHRFLKHTKLNDLKCKDQINRERANKSLGSLGGGNHFIEIDKGSDNSLYLIIHTGSRYLGKQVAELYQRRAFKNLKDHSKIKQDLINKLTKEGREHEIQAQLKAFKIPKVSKQLAYLEGEEFDNYFHDMKIVQEYSYYNREAILDVIIRGLDNIEVVESFQTIHNYIDTEGNILRKGAISAQKGKRLLIPINMKDGCILGKGKGNKDWNYSAPHGAGRLMSRSVARDNLKLEDYQESMQGIWSTSVRQDTIDEAPMAYKPINSIIDNIKDTVDIIDIIKPVYNFKS